MIGKHDRRRVPYDDNVTAAWKLHLFHVPTKPGYFPDQDQDQRSIFYHIHGNVVINMGYAFLTQSPVKTGI